MKALILFAVLCIFKANAFDIQFDPEACTTLPELPTPRVIDATNPQVFDSPGFNFSNPDGSIYPANTQCEWQIINTDSSQDLILTFFNFTLEYVTDCQTDRVEIYDGPDDTAPLIGIFCGIIVDQPQYTATDDSLFIRFISDDNNIEREGFLARVGASIAVTACDGAPQEFTAPYGSFFTENYPVNYGNNIVCEYYFNAPAGQKVEISFSDFDLAQNCNDDVVGVYEGAGPMFGTLVGNYYSDMRPARMTSVGNTAFIRFETDNTETSSGFAGYYQFIPA